MKVKSMVDVMAQVKLNALHLHLSDSQSFPIELEKFPDLSHVASYKDIIYSREQIRDLV